MKNTTIILDAETVRRQKEFIVKEFGIYLIESEERDDRLGFQYNGKSTDGYRYLAMINWPELFKENPNLEVHHINGDHCDNRLCNLVPVTRSQHNILHAKFFDDYKETLKRQWEVKRNNNGRKKPHKQSTKDAIGDFFRGKCRYKDENGKWHWI